MGALNTAADGLIRFLETSRRLQESPGSSLDRLGGALAAAGDAGLSPLEAMRASGLTRSEFFDALGQGQSVGILERSSDGGEERIRLTTAARQLYLAA